MDELGQETTHPAVKTSVSERHKPKRKSTLRYFPRASTLLCTFVPSTPDDRPPLSYLLALRVSSEASKLAPPLSLERTLRLANSALARRGAVLCRRSGSGVWRGRGWLRCAGSRGGRLVLGRWGRGRASGDGLCRVFGQSRTSGKGVQDGGVDRRVLWHRLDGSRCAGWLLDRCFLRRTGCGNVRCGLGSAGLRLGRGRGGGRYLGLLGLWKMSATAHI